MKRRAGARGEAGASRIGCLVSILLFVLVGYAAVEFIGAEVTYRDLLHEVQESVRAAYETPDREITRRIREKAEELDLPASASTPTIRRLADNRITVTVQYPDTITFFDRLHIVRDRRISVEGSY
ncbi:MAG: hypothetical protein R3266_09815 [Gemmatimonadota bacterium]|nr:hypothetical protein [Gemmatimonadota bacterium]